MNRIERIKELLIQSPNDCFLHHALALEYIKLNEDDKALELFEKNLQIDKNYVATYYHLGKLLERMGNITRSKEIFEVGMAVAKNINDNHSFGELQMALDMLED